MTIFGIPIFPEQASVFAKDVDALYFFILATCAFFAIGVSAAVVILGIKYHKITGDVELADKKPYDIDAARDQAAQHAGHFMFNRERQIEHLRRTLGRPPVVVAPYDAELFGHWWFEGPEFLEFFIRKAVHDQRTFRLATAT